MTEIFLKLLNISFSASLLIAACIVIRYLAKGMPKYMRCLLWILVLVRLACPFHLESPFSLLPQKEIIGSSSDVQRSAVVKLVKQNASVKDTDTSDMQSEVSSSGESMLSISRSYVVLILTVIWLIGIAIAFIYGLVAYIRLARCVDDAVLLRDNIYQSEKVSTPFILGIFRTRIYIPYNLSKTELYFVLSHERSHISRKDHLLKPAAYIISSIYWFNPLVWIGYSLLCRDIELACDEKAMRQIGYNKKKEYSQSILDLSVPRKYISACPVAFGESGVKERVRSVLSMKKGKKIAVVISALLIVAVGVGFLTYPKTKNKNSDTSKVTQAASGNKVEATSKDIVEEEKTSESADNESVEETTEAVGMASDKNKEAPVREETANSEETPEVAPENEEGPEVAPENEKVNESVLSAKPEDTGVKLVKIYLDDVVDSDSSSVVRLYSDEHQGVDIVANPGSDIISYNAGTVKASGFDNKNGYYIDIEDSEGNVYSYYHLQDLPTAKDGDSVEEGQVIGKLGNTGESTGPHLHFTVKDKNGESLDITVDTSDDNYEED